MFIDVHRYDSEGSSKAVKVNPDKVFAIEEDEGKAMLYFSNPLNCGRDSEPMKLVESAKEVERKIEGL